MTADVSKTITLLRMTSLALLVLGVCFLILAAFLFKKYRIWENFKKTNVQASQKTKKKDPVKSETKKPQKKISEDKVAESKAAEPETGAIEEVESTDALIEPTDVLDKPREAAEVPKEDKKEIAAQSQPEENEVVHFDESTDILIQETDVLTGDMDTDVLIQETDVLTGETEVLTEGHKEFTVIQKIKG